MTSLAHKCVGCVIGTRNIKRDVEMVLNLVFSGNSGFQVANLVVMS